MPLIKKNEAFPVRPVVILIYGMPGAGKTSLANTAKNPILIDTDRGADRAINRSDTIIASRWDDILTDEKEIKGHDTVIVDTARSVLDDFLVSHVCEHNTKLRYNKQQMYGAIGDEFKQFVNRLQVGDKDIIIIAHDKEDSSKDQVKHSPDVTGGSKNLLLRKADQVGYIYIVNNKRTITFEPSDDYIGKNVAQIPTMEIPDCKSPEYATFMADIIERVKTSISSMSEEQVKQLELIEDIKESINMMAQPEDADRILVELNKMDKGLAKGLKSLLLKQCESLSITYSKEESKFKQKA